MLPKERADSSPRTFRTKSILIPLAKPVFDEEMKYAALNALQNERFVLGESVFKFEEEFAKYCGVKHAISTSSGTSALQLSLIASGIRQNIDVVTSPTSFVATANAILQANAIPIFVDIDMQTCNINPRLIKRRLTRRTAAIIPVHLYGFPADMDPILEISRQHTLVVVEDACQAHGAEYRGQKVGSIGDAGCFSFYSSKNMTVCGDGGMIVTNDDRIAETAAKLRDCGRVSRERAYEHNAIGFTSRLNNVNAAIGRVQLKRLDEWNEKRRILAKLYCRFLRDLEEVILPPSDKFDTKPVYHLFAIRAKLRDELRCWLEERGVECGVHYPIPIHLQPIYKKMFGYKKGMLPESELHSKTTLSLPMSPFLTEHEVKFICRQIYDFFDKGKLALQYLQRIRALTN